MDEDQLGALIETIYTSALEEGGWGKLLQNLCAPFHAASITSATWRKPDAMPIFAATSLLDPSLVRDFETYYHAVDPGISTYRENIDAIAEMGVISRYELFPFDEYTKTEFYCDFGRNIGFGQSLTTIINNNAHLFANIHIHRPIQNNTFDDGEKKLLTALAPHLSRGLRIYREMTGLRAKASQFEAAFDTFAASFLLDHAGRVLALNRKAEELLAADGPLTVQNGRLTARHPPDQAKLDAALSRQAPGAPPPELVLHGPAYCPAVRLSIMPVNGAGNIPLFFDVTRTARGAFLVTAVALGPTVQSLTANYRLTRAEAEVAQLLAQGLKAQQIAAHRCASVATVNTQIKQVYAKTCVDGRAGLLVKLLGR